MTELNTEMPVGLPTKEDFDPSILREGQFDQHWEYGAGFGNKSKNYSGDYKIPDDHAIVEYAYHEHSGTNVRRQFIKLNYEQEHVFSVPTGVHVESNLNPEEHPGGRGASHKWTVYYTYVPIPIWMEKATKKALAIYSS